MTRSSVIEKVMKRFFLARRLALGLFWTLVAALICACGGPGADLTGTVVDSYTGKPVAGASIQVGGTTLTTDANGQYRTASWSAQDTLQISANDYEPSSIALSTRPDLAKPQPPQVTLDATIRPNTLRGHITDQYTNQPLAGALITASPAISATTDAEGNYTLKGLPERFTLAITAADHDTIQRPLERTTTFDLPLRPNVLTGQISDRATGKPLADVAVTAGSIAAKTDPQGNYRLAGLPESVDIHIVAEGYAAITRTLGLSTSLDLALRPDVFRGTLVDKTNGAPIANATIIALPQAGASAVASTRIDSSSDGTFALKGFPEQGFLEVLAPGYRKASIAIVPGTMPTKLELEPFSTRGLYITAAVASSSKLVDEYLDLIDRTELNSIVIDLKSDLRDDLGLVYYDSQVPLVKELKTSRDYMPIRDIVAEAKRRGIYTIARVHIFSHDNALADAKPEWAARDRTTGGVFADYPGPGIRYAWLDPWNQHVWDYNIQLSVEAAHMGFDEINFDYIRFPSLEFGAGDKDRLQLSREPSTAEERYANIGAVLERAQHAINDSGAFLSVDVFGYTTYGPGSLIGQNLQIMSQHTDYIMPMVYPSHFNLGELGFDNPAEHPYEIILDSMQRGEKQVAGKRARLRPWLQDFTLTWVPENLIVEYGPAQVRAQIKAVADYRKDAGWVLYDSANQYTEAALQPK